MTRIPRDRVLSFGGMLCFACTCGLFIYCAGYLAWQWVAGLLK